MGYIMEPATQSAPWLCRELKLETLQYMLYVMTQGQSYWNNCVAREFVSTVGQCIIK